MTDRSLNDPWTGRNVERLEKVLRLSQTALFRPSEYHRLLQHFRRRVRVPRSRVDRHTTQYPHKKSSGVSDNVLELALIINWHDTMAEIHINRALFFFFEHVHFYRNYACAQPICLVSLAGSGLWPRNETKRQQQVAVQSFSFLLKLRLRFGILGPVLPPFGRPIRLFKSRSPYI